MRTEPRRNRPAILVSGMIAGDPWQGGATWAVLQYVLGLRRLGHEVYLIEPIQHKAATQSLAGSEQAKYFDAVTLEFDLQQYAALLLAGTQQTYGISYAELRQIARRCEVLINVSGMLTDEALIEAIPIRVYLDLDPGFNQLWSAVQGINMRFAGHTNFVTIGQAIGDPECTTPCCGIKWLKTLQPVVLEHWPAQQGHGSGAFTTVGNWRGYGSIEHEGRHYGQKAHSMREFFELPRLTDEKFAVALAIHPNETKDLTALAANGWEVMDPATVAATPSAYQRFIQGSKAEFGIAKSGYVVSHSGWFSDRSVCYLASGRPVIAQETGFRRYLPTGEGLFAFSRTNDVLTAITELRGNYSLHARAARAIAEEYFDSDKVLPQLLEQVGAN